MARLGRAWKKAKQKSTQFRIESALRAGQLQSLVVNLALIGRVYPADAALLVVLVESMREALLLRFLGTVGLIPRSCVVIARDAEQIARIVRDQFERRGLSVVAWRLFLKYYQHLVDARNSGSVIII
jgi:hypothetical protein